MQRKIVHGPYSRHQFPWKSTTLPIHQCPAHGTEIIRHLGTGVYCFGLSEFSELFLAAEVLCGRFGDDEVGGEH